MYGKMKVCIRCQRNGCPDSFWGRGADRGVSDRDISVAEAGGRAFGQRIQYYRPMLSAAALHGGHGKTVGTTGADGGAGGVFLRQ